MYAIQSIFQFFLCFYYCKNSLENRKTSKMIVTLIIIFSNESHRFVKEIPILAADLLRGTTFVRLSTSTSNRERREGGGGEIDPSILEAYTSAKNNSNLLTSLSFLSFLLVSPSTSLSRDGTAKKRRVWCLVITRGLLR